MTKIALTLMHTELFVTGQILVVDSGALFSGQLIDFTISVSSFSKCPSPPRRPLNYYCRRSTRVNILLCSLTWVWAFEESGYQEWAFDRLCITVFNAPVLPRGRCKITPGRSLNYPNLAKNLPCLLMRSITSKFSPKRYDKQITN